MLTDKQVIVNVRLDAALKGLLARHKNFFHKVLAHKATHCGIFAEAHTILLALDSRLGQAPSLKLLLQKGQPTPQFIVASPPLRRRAPCLESAILDNHSVRRKRQQQATKVLIAKTFLLDNVFHPFDVEQLPVIAFFTLMGLADSLFRHESIVTSHQPTLDGNVRVRAS